MNVFIVGNPDSGSVRLAESLVKKFGLNLIQADRWFHDRTDEFPEVDNDGDLTPQQKQTTLEELSKRCVEDGPRACVDFVCENMSLTQDNVVTGLYDIADLFQLYNREKDVLIFMSRQHSGAWHDTPIGTSLQTYYTQIKNYIDLGLQDNILPCGRTKRIQYFAFTKKRNSSPSGPHHDFDDILTYSLEEAQEEIFEVMNSYL